MIHNKGLVHRDIKPDNFLLGLNNKSKQINIIDFGFCKTFLNDNKHIDIKIQEESYYHEFYDANYRTPEALKYVMDKHNKAKRLLFKIMNERIESWWD